MYKYVHLSEVVCLVDIHICVLHPCLYTDIHSGHYQLHIRWCLQDPGERVQYNKLLHFLMW